MLPDRFPRIVSGVTMIAAGGRTLVDTPSGRMSAASEFHPWLCAVAPLLDGSRTLTETIDAMPSERPTALRETLDLLAERGVVSMSDRCRPPGLRADLLALADLATGDPYARCLAFADTVAEVSAPTRWLAPLCGTLAQFGGRVDMHVDDAGGLEIRLGESVVSVGSDDPWLDADVPEPERRQFAAVLAAESIYRYFGGPVSALPEYGGIPGLSARGESVCREADLLEPWPSPDILSALVQDASVFLPREDPGHMPPAMVRPCPGARSERLPEPLHRVLSSVHQPLRWERGPRAHGHGRAHRGVASARALYPVELYLVTESTSWYLDPRDLAARAVVGHDSVPPDGRVCVAVTVRESKVAYRYGRYATRLCAQEAGLVIAGMLAAAEAASIPARVESALSDRGRGHAWGDRLALGDDERVVGLVWFDLDGATDESGRGFAAYRATVQCRRSGHQVFPSLGTPPVGDLRGMITILRRTLRRGIGAHVVTHRACATDDGILEPGCNEIIREGCRLEQAGDGPTEHLQRGQDAAGWLAVDYRSAFATVIVTARAGAIERDLASFIEVTADAAVVAHAAIHEAAALGLAARIHNGISSDTVIALTADEEVRALFQIIIGVAGADGTIIVDIVDPPPPDLVSESVGLREVAREDEHR